MTSTSPPLATPTPPAVRRGVVESLDRIAAATIRLGLSFDPVPRAIPGQFLHMRCDVGAEPQGSLRPTPFLRRPISISRVRPSGLEVIFQVLEGGLGTPRLAALAPGDPVDCLGPLGRGFTFRPALGTALLVGGGVGITPMIATGEWLVQRDVPCHAIAAARTRDLIALELHGTGAVTGARDFEAVQVPVEFATEDGSLGSQGLVTAPLAQRLNALRDTPDVEVFACGPRPMLAAVAALAAEWNRPCQVLMEEVMGCGIGVCLACVTKVRAPGAPGYTYQRVCTEGPAFDASEIVWT